MTPLLTSGNQQLLQWKRRWAAGINKMAGVGYTGARHTPMPPAVRSGLSGVLAWRPGTRHVPVDRLLLGGQNGVSAREYAAVTDDLLWPSRRVVEGPHARLLEAAMARDLDDVAILGSEYATMARRCIALSGQYFSALDDAGIVTVARDFLTTALAQPAEPTTAPKSHQSPPGRPIRVAPILDSDCYQVVDGHHRIAAGALAGVDVVPAQVNRWGVHTPLQSLLRRMSWIGGAKELYQPVPSPEVEGWPTVRRCDDRLDAMCDFLAGRPGALESYLDVASCYGWFVAGMRDRGYEAEGVERDPLAPQLGASVYRLEPERVTTSDAVEFLERTHNRWDVVSCFSLVHHFVLGRGSVDASDLVRLLDKVTESVLFLDTGQAHERWFSDSLAGWDTAAVRSFLVRETSFDHVIDLGPDDDDHPPYEGNYGRHLFACVRER